MQLTNSTLSQKEIMLTVNLASLNKILGTLSRLPYAEVYQLIQDIRTQAEQQLNDEFPEIKQMKS